MSDPPFLYAPCAQTFFKCLDNDNSAQAKWLRGLKANMGRAVYQRCLHAGESQDHSAHPIYLPEVRLLCKAFAMANSPEAAMRKLALKTLQRTCGRASEVGFLSYEGLRWDTLVEAPVMECPQSKTSKSKFIPFISGADRHADWAIDFGDYLILDQGLSFYAAMDESWLIPEVQGTSCGTKLTSFIKGMQKGSGGLEKYAKVAVDCLPINPTAAGFRPGCCDTLALAMPAEIAVHTTGHDLTNLSALWEYLSARIAFTIPGAVVLSGWRPLPRGELGPGPRCPNLQAVVDWGQITWEMLELYIDQLFAFHNSLAPPALRQGGELRAMMRMVTATLIMYYEERTAAEGEMLAVLHKMRLSVTVCALPGDDPHTTLKKWGEAIRTQFNNDNLHLTGGLNLSGSEQIIHNMKGLGQSCSRLVSGVSGLRAELAAATSELAAVKAQFAALSASLVTRGIPVPPTPAVPPTPGGIPPIPIVLDAPATPAPATPAPTVAVAVASAPPAVAPASTGGPSHTCHEDGIGMSGLKLGGLSCIKFYIQVKTIYRGREPPVHGESGNKSRADQVFEFFENMSTPEEQEILKAKPPNMVKCMEVVTLLNNLILDMIERGYALQGVKKQRLRTSELMVNSLNPHIRNANVDTSSSACHRFRNVGAPPLVTTPPLVRMMRAASKQPPVDEEAQGGSDGSDVVVCTGERKRARSDSD